MAIDKLPQGSYRKQPNRLRTWGELAGDDGADDLSYLLPPRQVIGPDENGIKKVIEYKFDGKGRRVRVTTTKRVQKLNARLSKGAIERRSWSKFGDAAEEDDVGTGRTSVSREEILLERHIRIGSKAEGNNTAGDSLAENVKAGAIIMVCRTCGKKGDHWTARCPYKDLAPQSEVPTDRPGSSDSTTRDSSILNGKSTYVPPSKRGGNASTVPELKRRNDENAVRVGNLSEDTCEADLLELFRPFGQVLRAHVVKDHKTNVSRGFGFVNFANHEDAQRAIAKLDGYGYDNLILHVEWSAPRSN